MSNNLVELAQLLGRRLQGPERGQQPADRQLAVVPERQPLEPELEPVPGPGW